MSAATVLGRAARRRALLVALGLAAVVPLAGCRTEHDPGPTIVSAEASRSEHAQRSDGRSEHHRPPRDRSADGGPDAVGIGIYNGHVTYSDGDTVRQFGAYPQVASSYYQPYEPVNIPLETQRIQRGIVPNLTITTKGTQLIAALAGGRSHPGHDEALAWLDAYVESLATLAAVDPEVPVYATIDHEYKVKVRTGMITGPSADLDAYARTLTMFYRRAHAAHPAIRVTYWMVGYDRLVEGAIGDKLRAAPDAILIDPYANTPADSIASITAPDVRWIRNEPWYDGQEIALGELGMPVRFGDRALAAFYSDAREQLADLGVSWAVVFNRERGFDSRITERTDGVVFPQAAEVVTEALQQAVPADFTASLRSTP